MFNVALFVAGFGIFLWILPHRHPWFPKVINTTGWIQDPVTLWIPLWEVEFTLPGTILFLSILFLFMALIFMIPFSRKAAAAIVRSPQHLASFGLPWILFAATLFPTKNGMPIILYLLIASLGLTCMLAAGYPLLFKVMHLRFGQWLRLRMLGRIRDRFFRLDSRYFVMAVFSLSLAITSLTSHFVFDRIPHVQDNIDQLFHAKIFLSGRLTAPSPEYPEFFEFDHMIHNGRWYSVYPPGHIAMLFIGLIFGVPWLVNPVLGSGAIVVLYMAGRKIYGDPIGRLTALLGLLSPFILFMSSGFFNHGTSLFFSALFFLFFVKSFEENRTGCAFLAGLFLGVCFNARPLTAIGIGLPYALYMGWLLLRRTKTSLPTAAVMFVGFSLMVGIFMGYNTLTNGHPLKTGYEARYGRETQLGFRDNDRFTAHSPKDGLIQNLNNLNALNKSLFEWCIPSTFFVLLLFVGKHKTRWDKLLLASAFSLSFAYFFHWYQGWSFGPRLMYEASFPLILLSAKGILHAPQIIEERFKVKIPPEQTAQVVHFMILVCLAVAFVVNVPHLVRLYSHNYWGVNTVLQKEIEKRHIKNAVIFVDSRYGSVFPLNAPLLDGNIIYARNLESKNKVLMQSNPGRRYYLASNGQIEAVYPEFYNGFGKSAFSNSDFEGGELSGWTTSGNAWSLSHRPRMGRQGVFHAESLGKGETATGTLRSDPFLIQGGLILFLKNGFTGGSRGTNVYFLKDAASREILRKASPPNQDEFATHFWFVSDLKGKRVYFEVVDGDDDQTEKDGYAWIGIDALRHIR